MWKSIKLGDVVNIQNGYAFKSKEYSSDGYFVMRITNVQKGYISNHNPRYVQIKSNSNLEKFILKEQDILLSLTGDVGRVGIVKKEHLPCVLNQRVAKINVIDESILNKDFLFLFLNSDIFLKEVEKLSHGTAQSNAATKDIHSIKFNLPSLTEQQRIVAKLDAVFAEIGKSINITEHKKKEADILRQNILAKELKIGTDVKKLSDVCQINNGGTPDSKNKLYWGGNNHWLTPKDMGRLSSHHVDASERQITDEGLNNSSAKLVPQNSVILSCRAPIGYLAINSVPMSFNQGCKGLVPKPNLLAKYLYYFLLSSKQLLNDLGSGTTFKEISSKTLSNVIINIPSLIEQKRIVAKLDLTFAEVKKIKSYTEKQIVNYQTLKSAILTKELHKEAA